MKAIYAIFLCSILSSANVFAQATATATAHAGIKISRSNQAGKLNLYPNPAKTYMNVYVDWKEPQTFRVAIYASTNTLVKEWDEQVRTSYQKSVDVTQLPDGKYAIVVTGKKGELADYFTVKH